MSAAVGGVNNIRAPLTVNHGLLNVLNGQIFTCLQAYATCSPLRRIGNELHSTLYPGEKIRDLAPG